MVLVLFLRLLILKWMPWLCCSGVHCFLCGSKITSMLRRMDLLGIIAKQKKITCALEQRYSVSPSAMYFPDVCDLHACWVGLIFFEVILRNVYALRAKLGLWYIDCFSVWYPSGFNCSRAVEPSLYSRENRWLWNCTFSRIYRLQQQPPDCFENSVWGCQDLSYLQLYSFGRIGIHS